MRTTVCAALVIALGVFVGCSAPTTPPAPDLILYNGTILTGHDAPTCWGLDKATPNNPVAIPGPPGATATN